MKLIIAIVHDEDVHELSHALNVERIGMTKMASTGGFLRAGNTTLLIGVEADRVDHVLEIIQKNCKKRRELTTTSSMISEAGFMAMPLEVTVGGATVFILDVEQHYKY